MTYAPYLPQNTLTAIDEGLWTVDGPCVSYTFAGITIPCPTRMTIFTDGSGGMMIHSPTAFDAELADAIAQLGRVSGIIAPNSFHFLNLNTWADHFRGASIFATPVMPAKAGLPHRTQTFGNGALCATTDVQIADGGAWTEGVFFHKPSGSVIFTDLVQNFELSRVTGALTKFMLWSGGATGNPPSASIEMRLAAIFAGKRKTLRNDFNAIKAWKPKRALITHGQQPQDPADVVLDQGFAWA